MSLGPDALTADALAFLTERHLATFSSVRRAGTVHVTAVGFTWDPDAAVARVITTGGNQKATNASAPGGTPAAVCQVDGARWLTLEGVARTVTDPESVRDAEARYAARYRTPRENPKRVVIEIEVTRVIGSRGLIDR